MEEVKKIITVKNARYPENLYIGEKANFGRKVCICECPDTSSETPTWWPVMAEITAWFHGHLACVNVHHGVIDIIILLFKL